jgi:hypothetical protein
MSAKAYSVTFGYGEYDGYYYTAAKPHRGNDRPTPTGTPIFVVNTVIGYTGATGLVSGPHLHTQAGTDINCQNTIHPGSLEFQPGTVVRTGTASQWGNYIIVQVGALYICYAHLSSINAQVGQVINGTVTGGSTVDTIKSMYWRLLGREADAGGLSHHAANVSSKGWEFVYNDLKSSTEGQSDWARRNPDRVHQLEVQNAQKDQAIAQLQTALTNEQSKPPKEVVKEVEKIVTQTVEVIKEVPVYTHDERLTKDVASIRGMLINFIGYVKAKLGK